MGELNLGDNNVRIGGTLVVSTGASLPSECITTTNVSSTYPIARAKLAQDALKVYPIPLTSFRTWDAMATVLPGTSANDDLGLIGGTFATNSPSLQTYDVKSAGALTFYGRCIFAMPAEYDAAETVTLRIKCGMVTTVADTSCTIDAVVYESNKERGIGADLCATGAQSMNSLTFANKDFTITPTGLDAGDVLDIRLALAVNDAAGGAEVIGCVGTVEMLCDVRG